jgi:site-specific recombinase XerD
MVQHQVEVPRVIHTNSSFNFRPNRLAAFAEIELVRLDSGRVVLIDADGRPILPVNAYLRVLMLKRQAQSTVDGAAYVLRKWCEAAASAGIDPFNPTNEAMEEFLEKAHAGKQQEALAHDISRLWGFFRYSQSVGFTARVPFRLRPSRPRITYRTQGGLVPDSIPRGRRCVIILPSRREFEAVYERLSPAVKLLCEIMISTGARAREALALPSAWKSARVSAAGVYMVKVKRKGGHLAPIYVDRKLALRITEAIGEATEFYDAGRPLTYKRLARALHEASAASSHKITCHTFRHAYASWLYHQLVWLRDNEPGYRGPDPLLVVQFLLDHASSEITLGKYIHLFAVDPGDRFSMVPRLSIAALVQSLPPELVPKRTRLAIQGD